MVLYKKKHKEKRKKIIKPIEKEIDGNTVKICKFCNAQLKNFAKKGARASKVAAAEAPAEA